MEKGGEKRSGTGEDGIGRLFNIITNLLKEKDIYYIFFLVKRNKLHGTQFISRSSIL